MAKVQSMGFSYGAYVCMQPENLAYANMHHFAPNAIIELQSRHIHTPRSDPV